GLARVPAGNQILVQLDLNLDGMLRVSARERATGLQKQVTIENALSRYENEERDLARERLEGLWQRSGETFEDFEGAEGEDLSGFEGEDEGEAELPTGPPELVSGPREGQRETVQARALLEKCDRLLPNLQPEDRAEVERLMGNVRNALTDRKWDQLTSACNELSDVLFYLEE